ncbi:FHA domain-containing protein [Nocardioides speluncae]|uniref:FHA domain-containing protein n=1 Tax=Nocardioides speluncae TaxID=2670337 RepID=UPI0012B1823D|nr:hypothetical protein [Nocardioides speluncae]
MSARAWYAAGPGLLVGQGDHWLLIGVEPPDALVDALWQTVVTGGPGTSRALTDIVAGHYGNIVPPLVIVDTSPEAEPPVLRSGGQMSGDDAAYHLSVGQEATGGLRPFGGGVVPAALAEIRPSRQAAAPAAEKPVIPGIIDGIPPEILAASSTVPPRTGFQRPVFTADPPVEEPTRVVGGSAGFETVASATSSTDGAEQASTVRRDDQRSPTVVRPERHQLDHDGSTVGLQVPGEVAEDHDGMTTHLVRPQTEDVDHDGMTTHRPSAGFETVAEQPPQPAEDVDHLSHNTRETVLAVHCPRGHVTPAYTPNCRTCNAPVPPQEPQRLPRPRLGGLILPTGETVPLDRGVVFGRKPAPMPGGEEWPHLVYLPQDSSYLSRMHLAIELDGWLVMAQDLGARGGTTLKVPGRPPEKLRAGETYVLEAGHAVDLADVYEIVFEVNA